jgi:hypothetical protein
MVHLADNFDLDIGQPSGFCFCFGSHSQIPAEDTIVSKIQLSGLCV